MGELMVSAVQKLPGGRGRGRGAPAMPAGQPSQTNDIGEFRISGLAAGDYYVTASPAPTSPFGSSSTSGDTTPITTFYPGSPEIAGAQVISVAAGQTIAGLEFSMLSARGFTVSGAVVDEMNRPVGGAMVMLMPTQMVGPGLRGSSRTRPDGTFTIGRVAPGSYRLNASVPVTVSGGGGTVSTGGGTVTWGASGGVASGAGGLVTYSSAAGPGSTTQVTVGDADVTGITVVVRQR